MNTFVLIAQVGVDAVVTALLAHGLPGIALLALGWAYIQQQKDAKEAQAQRVADAQRVTEQLVQLNTSVVAALTRATEAMQATKEAVEEVRDGLRELGRDVRDPAQRPRA